MDGVGEEKEIRNKEKKKRSRVGRKVKKNGEEPEWKKRKRG